MAKKKKEVKKTIDDVMKNIILNIVHIDKYKSSNCVKYDQLIYILCKLWEELKETE